MTVGCLLGAPEQASRRCPAEVASSRLTAQRTSRHYSASMVTRSATAITHAARLIRAAKHLTAFTGAGISVESGIPPFRGEGGLWNKYDPRSFEVGFFRAHPEEGWPVLKEIFYATF